LCKRTVSWYCVNFVDIGSVKTVSTGAWQSRIEQSRILGHEKIA
jgi:hypothetical protein